MALFSSILTLGRCGGGLYYATCHRFAVFDVFLAAWPLTSHAGMVRTTSKFDAISLNSTPAIRRRLNRLSPKFAGWLRFGYLPQRKISLRSDRILPPPQYAKLLTECSFVYLLDSDNSLPPKRLLRRFWWPIRQKTSFRTTICLWGSKMLHFDPIFPQNGNFRSIFDETWLKTGFNIGTLSVNVKIGGLKSV